MQVNKRNTTHKKLILLIGIFIFGFISLIALNKVFTDLVDKLDKESKNLEAKINLLTSFLFHITQS